MIETTRLKKRIISIALLGFLVVAPSSAMSAVAVRPKGGAFSVDLYFDRRDTRAILDLHASAKLGEREGTFGKWPEWLWWNNRGWAAKRCAGRDVRAARIPCRRG
jgi:hypothetical protein